MLQAVSAAFRKTIHRRASDDAEEETRAESYRNASATGSNGKTTDTSSGLSSQASTLNGRDSRDPEQQTPSGNDEIRVESSAEDAP